jgi:hypothetical protein
MSSSDLIRWGGIAAMISGVLFIVGALFVLTDPPETIREVLFLLPVLFAIAGLVGFHALQKDAYGRIGQAGFWTAILAGSGEILAILVFLAGSEALSWLAFPVGLLGMFVGFVLYGAATLQARVLPRWCGVAFIIVFPITVLLGAYGNIWFGLVWLALGYTLWSRREASKERPSRVS